MANAAKEQLSVAEQLQKEQEETQARLKSAAQDRLKEVDEQIGPLQKERGELVSFLGIEEKKPEPSPAPAPAQRQRRSRKGGTRQEQAVKLVEESPGIRASEIASKMKIKPNYLYRVLAEAVKDGEVEKKGQTYHPVAA